MGNVQEPANKPNIKKKKGNEEEPIIPGCLSSFMKTIPIEIKILTFAYVPLNDLPNLLLISKPLKNSILRNDEIFANYYRTFREKAIIENAKLNGTYRAGIRLDIELPDEYYNNPALPLSIDQLENTKFKGSKNLSKNYRKLEIVVKNQIRMRQSVNSLRIAE